MSVERSAGFFRALDLTYQDNGGRSDQRPEAGPSSAGKLMTLGLSLGTRKKQAGTTTKGCPGPDQFLVSPESVLR